MRSNLSPLLTLVLLAPGALASPHNSPASDPLAGEAGLRGPLALEPVALEPARTPFDELERAMKSSRMWLNLRYRHEHVSHARFGPHANASTLRTVFGMETGQWNGMRAVLEVEDVSPLGDETFNSGVNGNLNYPTVSDPNGTEINQAYVALGDPDELDLRIGRQTIQYDNERFIGDFDWRQNHQSFDAVSLNFGAGQDTSVRYAYVRNVNTVFGDANPAGDIGADAHFINVSQTFEGVGSMSAYYYHLDLDDVPGQSSATYGTRLDVTQEISKNNAFLFEVEYAQQKDVGSNPVNLDQSYYLADFGIRTSGLTIRFGREFLGGSGRTVGGAADAFSTPLATLHNFNGYADAFLVTPAGGLVDEWIGLSTDLGKLAASVTYHDFESDRGDRPYGDEFDADLIYPFSERTEIGVRFAYYDSHSPAFPHVTKLMAWMTYNVL